MFSGVDQVCPPSVERTMSTSVLVLLAVPFRLSANVRYRCPLLGSMSMFPAAFVRAHIRSSVWLPWHIGYLPGPSKTVVIRVGCDHVRPPLVERTIRYWFSPLVLKFSNAT